MSAPWRRTALVLLSTALAVVASLSVGGPTVGQEPNRAAIVVQHGDLVTSSMCVTFPSDQITGFELLERSGLEFIAQRFDFGRSVCWLDGEGCNYPEEDCFCDPVNFWGYWTQGEGEPIPAQSDRGPDDRTLEDGDLDHWVWGPAGAAPVPQGFSDVCPAQAASPGPTAMPTNGPATLSPSGGDEPGGRTEPLPNTGTGPVPLPAMGAILIAPAAVVAAATLRRRR